MSVGNTLLLRGLWLAVAVALNKGAVVLEHPAMPIELYKPSIWRTAVILLLLRRPYSLFYPKMIQQWRFGAAGVKPTTLLCANVSLEAPLASCALDHVQKPSGQLIGRATDGSFRTAQAKEYPPALNKALAEAFSLSISRLPGCSNPVRLIDEEFSSKLAALSACVDHSHSALPDFQPEHAFALD